MNMHPTRPQLRVLSACRDTNLNEGRIELSMQTGMAGTALERVIASCLRRGWIGEDGWTSPEGERLLKVANL